MYWDLLSKGERKTIHAIFSLPKKRFPFVYPAKACIFKTRFYFLSSTDYLLKENIITKEQKECIEDIFNDWERFDKPRKNAIRVFAKNELTTQDAKLLIYVWEHFLLYAEEMADIINNRRPKK